MAIFDAGSPAFQSTASVGTTATLIWSGTASALTGLSPATTLRDITIVNTGTNPCYVGGSSVTTAAMYLPAGGQLTVQGWTVTSGTTTRDIYAIVLGVGLTTSTQAGLATLASVV